MNIQENLNRLTESQVRYYSEQAVVMQTYRISDQKKLYDEGKLTVEYDPYLHILCDVRLVRDGSMLYGVKLTPQPLIRDSSGNVISTIIDGTSEVTPSTNNLKVDVPRIGSYVFISWLSQEDAYVSFQSSTESVVVGDVNGAYIDFYVKDETRIIDLINADEFKVQFPNGMIFNIKTDIQTSISELIIRMNRILLQADNSKIDLYESVDILVSSTGKITISNGSENLKTILTDLIDELINYFTTIQPILATAGLTSAPTITNLNKVKVQIDSLLN